ncbi:MAG: hypothetical protein Q4F28_11580 [Eubacteriales bacterium]|nr:hypothetical protein [Eubacteriales bacterium]
MADHLLNLVDETQFENDIVNYIEIAKDYIFKYRKFRDILYAKEYMMNNLDDNNWNPYYKAMFCFLTDDIFPGQKYYQMFLDNSFFERIMKQDNYPEKVEDLNKEYVLDMIRNQRHYWHSKTAMKKMKNYPEWE